MTEFKKNYFYFKTVNGVASQVIGLMFENVRLIKLIKLWSDIYDDRELTVKLNINYYRLRALKKMVNNYTLDQLSKILKIIYNYDINKISFKNSDDYFHLVLLKIFKVGDEVNESSKNTY